MRSRKERLESKKRQLLSENIRSVKKATTYIGTTVLMGTAGLMLNKSKTQADTVQVDKNTATNNDQETSSTANATNTQSVMDSSSNTRAAEIQASSSETQVTANQAQATSQAVTQARSSVQTQTSQASQTTSTAAQANPVQAASNNLTQATTVNVSGYSSNVQNFLNNIASSAQQVAQQRGLYASLMIAQAALESGWGGSYLSTSAYNLFGVKWSGSGAYIELPTQEFYGGAYHTIYDKFQRYSSYTESLNGYANLIIRNFPRSTKANAASYAIAAQNLRNGVYGSYATAPDYAQKLIRVIQTYNLTAYDVGGQTTPDQNVTPDNVNNNTNQNNNQSATGTYKVVSGDSLYRIARNHNMSVQTLKSLNNLSSDLIYVGQTLKVSGSTNNTNNNTSNNTPSNTNTNTSQNNNQSVTGTYKVVSGDSLYRIARNHNMSVQTLKSLNNLSSDTIYVGQTLKVSGSTNNTNNNTSNNTPSNTNTNTNQNNNQSATGTYKVVSGDSLYRIARNHNMSVQMLKSLNNLSSDLILPGQTLKVSGTTNTSSNANNTSTNRPSNTNNNASQNNNQSSTGTYKVVAGDNLYRIARDHNMSLQELKRLNNLSNDLILPVQTLKVAATKTQTQTTQTNNTPQNTTNNTTTGTYTVKAGDSLWAIANAHKTTVRAIKQANNLTNDFIYVGQKLKVSTTAANTTKTSNTTSNSSKESNYTVKAGDSLWKIASKNGTTVNQLRALNNLTSDLIYVGQNLKLK